MSGSWKDQEHETGKDTNPNRQHCENFLGLGGRYRVEACNDVLVEHRDRRKNHHRHQCVEEVDELDPIAVESILR